MPQQAGPGRPQLERLFRERVGVTPKVYARLLRFEASLSLARRGARWAEVAAGAGFADQSHLVREYRALAGTSPSLLATEWRTSGFPMPVFPMPGLSMSVFSKTGPSPLPTLGAAAKEDG